jgi:hypothetical protein
MPAQCLCWTGLLCPAPEFALRGAQLVLDQAAPPLALAQPNHHAVPMQDVEALPRYGGSFMHQVAITLSHYSSPLGGGWGPYPRQLRRPIAGAAAGGGPCQRCCGPGTLGRRAAAC